MSRDNTIIIENDTTADLQLLHNYVQRMDIKPYHIAHAEVTYICYGIYTSEQITEVLGEYGMSPDSDLEW